jgi:cytoskeleton protein RodZ
MMAYVDHDEAQPALGTSRVGAELCAARQRLGWQLPDVAANLRIRLPFLEAIEEGRIADLPGNAYAMGFVRTYATSLGLDADEVARRFRTEAQDVTRKTELTFPAPVPQRGVPAMAVVLLGIIIAAGAYVGWYRYTGNNEAAVAQSSAPPPERLAAMAPAPVTTSPQVASILPSSPPPAPGQTPAAVLPVHPPVPVPVPVAIAPPAPLPPAPPITTRLVLRAKTGGWVQVREKQGQVLLNRVLRPGETWPVPMKPQLLLTTSNAGSLELLVDGVAAPSLGPIGAMRRDVPLDPETISAGKGVPRSTDAASPR